ncbi:hypothetical protein Scep_029816 [Stephania cephalantha]|uniref:Uncharacterized protein n=1 Tax=Stephania cephalantha TaxID=152367 RepID=A0AAP0E1C7_9MAGN
MLQLYAIADREADFENALQNGAVKVSSSGHGSNKKMKVCSLTMKIVCEKSYQDD